MRLVLLVLALAACDVDRTFECATDAQCEGGRCEATRYCSFADGVCASGQRYDEYAGDGLSGACVPDGDVQPPDCPTGYAPIAGQTSSYRYVTTATDWLAAELDCEDDGTGTHLAVVDTDAENMALDTLMAGEDAYWLGISDRRVEGTYRTVTDDVQTFLPWDDMEPTGAAEDCVYAEDKDFVDTDCAAPRAYICECDGRAAVPAAY